MRSLAEQRLALVLLAGGLVLTATVSVALARKASGDRRRELDSLATQARTAIGQRVASYAEPLYGMSAILSGDPTPGRVAFHRYVEVAGTARRQPGLLAYTFNRFVPAAGVAAFEQTVRSDTTLAPGGYPAFHVFPDPGSVADRVVIDFVEPTAGNEAIFGYDVASDAARRRAIEAARDSGHLVASEAVMLLQEGGVPGFAMYVPVYRTSQVPDTAPARRRHFAGVATAAVGLDQMLADVLGPVPGERPRLRVQISDVGTALDSPARTGRGGTILFDSAGGAGGRSLPVAGGGQVSAGRRRRARWGRRRRGRARRTPGCPDAARRRCPRSRPAPAG